MPRGVAGTGSWQTVWTPEKGTHVIWVEDKPKGGGGGKGKGKGGGGGKGKGGGRSGSGGGGTNRWGGPKGTKKDAAGRKYSDPKHARFTSGGSSARTGGGTTKADADALRKQREEELAAKAAEVAERRAKQAAERAARIAEREAREAQLAAEAEEQRKLAEAEAERLAKTRERVRNRRRRLARLRREGVDAEQEDAVAEKLRQARLNRNAKREAYARLEREARLARARLLAQQDRSRRDPKGKREDPEEEVPAHILLGETEEGKKDKSLKKRNILDEVKDIRRRQKESGNALLDQERLRNLDARLDFIAARTAEKLEKTIKEAERLEKKAVQYDKDGNFVRVKDRNALAKLEKLVESEETKQIFKQREFLFGRKPGDVGMFDRYYSHRRVINNRYNEYWTDKLTTAASNEWHARNARARSAGLAQRNLMAAGVLSREGPDDPDALLDPIRADEPSQIGLNPDGSWSEAPPEEQAKFLANQIMERAIKVNPGVKLFAQIKQANERKISNTHEYVYEAAKAEGLFPEDSTHEDFSWQFTDPSIIDKSVDAAVRQFKVDWEAKNGPTGDLGIDVAGFFNFSMASDEQKRRSDEYRLAEEEFRNGLYGLYQDRKAPGAIEGLLNEWVAPVVMPVAELAGGAWGGFWAGALGTTNTPVKPPSFKALRSARTKLELIANGVPEWMLTRVPDDFNLDDLTDEEVQEIVDESLKYGGFGENVGPGLNILNPAVWAGGPRPHETEEWAKEQGYDVTRWYTEQTAGNARMGTMTFEAFDQQAFLAYLKENKAEQREYFKAFPSAQGLIVAPEDQLNAPDDARFTASDGLGGLLGFKQDTGQTAVERAYSEQKERSEEFHEAAPGTSAIDHFWTQVRILNESPNVLQREPGGGAIATSRMASMVADPLMLAKPGRIARIFQYGIAEGAGITGKTGLITRELINNRFGFQIPGRGRFGLDVGEDTVGRWLDSKKLPKDLRKSLMNKDDFTEAELRTLLDDYAGKTGKDPLIMARGEGFGDFLKWAYESTGRKFSPQKINSKQLQSATERYIKRQLAREGVEVIERADQAVLRRKAAKFRDAVDAEDAAAVRAKADEAAELRARKAARDAEAQRQSTTAAKKRSVFEAADDFVEGASDDLGRAAGDFRSPVAHEVTGGYAVRYYRKGLKKAKDGASVFAVSAPRHAEDVIAIADGIARRYGLAVRWVRSPKSLGRNARPMVELFGGSAEQMAKAADELDVLMKKHRLGQKTKSHRYRALDPSDGRVLFRDRFKDAAREQASIQGDRIGIAEHRLLEKVRLRKSQLKRLRQLKNKQLVKELGDLQDQIDSLDGAARKGDKSASAQQAALYKKAKAVEDKIGRVQALEDRIIERQRRLASDAKTGIGPLDAAQSEALITQLGGTSKWIDSQLRVARLRLKADPNNKQLMSRIEWLEQARIGQRLLMDDVAGPVAVARKVVKNHGADATSLQKASEVAPIVPAAPPSGMSQRSYGLMDIGRGLRARLTRMKPTAPVGGVEGKKALKSWLENSAKAKFNKLKLDDLGLDLDGFDDIVPILRALRSADYYNITKHPKIKKWLQLQIAYAEKNGKINWKQVSKEFGIPLDDEWDMVEALAKMRTAEQASKVSFGLDTFRQLDQKVSEAVRAADGGANRPFTKGGGPRRFYDDATDSQAHALQDVRDYDVNIVKAKADALRGTGWTVEMYDQARTVLQDTLVKEQRMDTLIDLAKARAKKDGISFEDAMKIERDAMARKVSDEKLRRWAMQSPYGLTEQEVWDDFVRSSLDEQLTVGGDIIVTPFQARIVQESVSNLTGVRNVLDNDTWSKGIKAVAPSQELASDARQFLVDMGHWAPKTANDIREGKRVWSAADEADYYMANYGFKPKWADTTWLLEQGAFDSEFVYNKIMTELGVWDNTVDVELRLSSLDADAQQLRLIWGDERNGVKMLRSIEDQRNWMAERWQGTVYRAPTKARPGHMTRIPWLMDPSSREYARWLSDATKKYVDDASLMAADDAAKLSRTIQQRMQYNMEQLRKAAAAGDGTVLEQEVLRQSIKLTDDLLANPTWKPLFNLRKGIVARNNAAFSLISGLGYIQRLNTITQMAFGFINVWEVSPIGMKNWLARLYVRGQGGVGWSDVPDFIKARFPDIESTGMGSGTTIWDRVGSGNFGRAGEALNRLKDPTRSLRDVADLTIGGVKGLPEIGLIVSARAEQHLKRQMFLRLYTDRFAKFMREGMSEAQADLLARKLAADMTNSFFPNLENASWWYKALNEVVPFLHYNWATTTLYAKEFIANPWIIAKMEYLGHELERVNRELWELENEGLPYPRGSAGSKLNITVGGTTFVIDFLGLSDVARGSRLVAKLTDGTEMRLADWFRQFVRIPHPWQAQLYSYLMDKPSWYTGEKVSLGDIVWPAGVIEWYHEAIEDGDIGQADWFKLISRAAFFSEAQSLNPLQSMEQAYFALPEEGDAREKFLKRFPELKEYWQTKDPSAAKQILINNGILPQNFWQTVTPEVAEATRKAIDLYKKAASDWDQKLQSYLDSGGSPLDEAYKELKNERFEALTDMRNSNVYLYNRHMFYNDPLDWDATLQKEYRDSLYDKYQSFDKFIPQRKDYDSDIEYQQALVDFHQLKNDWLEAHPELFETLGRERTQLELAVADVYEEMGEVYSSIGERNLLIAQAEAKGADRLVSALYGINELRYEQLEDTTVVQIDREPSLEVQQALDAGDTPAQVESAITGADSAAAIVSIPGATDQRYRNASPEERKEIRRDFWYREAIQQVFETSDSGTEFLNRLDNRPRLKAEYLRRMKEDDPAAYKNFMDREYYHDKLDTVMAKVKATGDWSHWWNALEKDKRFREYYMRTHPDKYTGRFDANMRQFKKMGAIVKKAEATGDWSHFWQALKKDKKLRDWWLDQEPGRRAKWRQQAAYYSKLAPVVKRAVATGDWREFNKLLRTDAKFREQYFANNPEKKQQWLQNEAYAAAMNRWQTLMKKNPEKGQDYFSSLPKWMQSRFYKSSPKNAQTYQSNAYTRAMTTWGRLFDMKGAAAAMAYFHSLPASIKNQYYATHPGQREKFAQNDAYGASMKKWVSFFKKEDYDGAEKYFNSLPLWMRKRYFSNNPDKKPGAGYTYPVPDWKMDERMGKLLSRFYQEDAEGRARILANNPAFRRYFRDRKKGGSEARRAMILAAYEALPKDPWLRRVFQERYPEVFSEEAEGVRRNQRVMDFLAENAGIRPAYQNALKYLTQTYLGSVQGYGARPKKMEVERLNEEKKRRRRRHEAMRHKGTLEWKTNGTVPRDIPGLVNVLTGKA